MSNQDKAKQHLKQLQAQINGMRLALATACTTCEVDAVVDLLKTIAKGVSEAIQYLDIDSYDLENIKESQDITVEEGQETEKEVSEDGNYQSSEMYKQIDTLLNKSVESTMNLTKSTDIEDVLPEQDADALLSLANLMKQQDENVKEISEINEIKPKVKSSLDQIPVAFNLQNQNPEDYINGRN